MHAQHMGASHANAGPSQGHGTVHGLLPAADTDRSGGKSSSTGPSQRSSVVHELPALHAHGSDAAGEAGAQFAAATHSTSTAQLHMPAAAVQHTNGSLLGAAASRNLRRMSGASSHKPQGEQSAGDIKARRRASVLGPSATPAGPRKEDHSDTCGASAHPEAIQQPSATPGEIATPSCAINLMRPGSATWTVGRL